MITFHFESKIAGCNPQVDDMELKRRYSPYVEQSIMIIQANDVTADVC